MRSADPKLFAADAMPPSTEDSTSGPGAPDLEYFVTPTAYTEHGNGPIPSGHLWSLHVILLRQVLALLLRNPHPKIHIQTHKPRHYHSQIS